MPINAQQLLNGANYQLMEYAANDPVDQIDYAKPFSKWLMDHKMPSVFGNGTFNEKVRISNAGNYQNYTGDQQVTYNKRDTARVAPFLHYEAHDGFTLNETELADNGIILVDDPDAKMTGAEEVQIVNKIKENYTVLKQGFQASWDLEIHQNGAQSALACPGLDYLVSTTPTVGVVGGLDPAVYTFWQNNANLAISTATAGVLTSQMEQQWRACTQFGGYPPDKIFVGSKFLDAYRQDAPLTVNRQLQVADGKGGYKVDNGASGIFFKGVELVWDPSFDALDALLGPITYPWAKRCYFLNSKFIHLRPNKGRWMINRKPPRIYDRYTYFWGLTADYGLTISKRNAQSVLSIA